jgi:hypothetical protein
VVHSQQQPAAGDELVYTPSYVEHWHGGAAAEGGRYPATPPGGEADVTWLEAVTEQDYAMKAVSGKKPDNKG